MLAQVGRVKRPVNVAIPTETAASFQKARMSGAILGAGLATSGAAWLAMRALQQCGCHLTTPHTSEGPAVPANDLIRERIEAFNQARGGCVALHKVGRGYSLVSQRTGARCPVSSQPGTPTGCRYSGRAANAGAPHGRPKSGLRSLAPEWVITIGRTSRSQSPEYAEVTGRSWHPPSAVCVWLSSYWTCQHGADAV